MHETHAHEPRREGDAKAPPSSSRMLASYLTDIEQLLDEQSWEAALREAFDIPRIAAALMDPGLYSTRARALAWCEEWVTAAQTVCSAVAERAAQEHSDNMEGVPSLALRRLRLRRLVRTPPRGFLPERALRTDPREAEAIEICTALVDAARRWYAQGACHDATVQANLARLAVLR